MKVRKLTPNILKKIIAEEKAKIKRSKKTRTRRNVNLIEQKVNNLTKLALLEAREKIKLRKIRKVRELIKKSLR
jgi:hypothetical protein